VETVAPATYSLLRMREAAWRLGVSVRGYREIEAGEPLAELRDVGPDLQDVRLVSDVRGHPV
jgi:hypothetical protein